MRCFNGSSFINSMDFKEFGGKGPTESLYDFSVLSDEALALAAALDASDAICQSGNNEWGSTTNIVTGTAQEVLNVIKMFNLSVAPQMVRELELGVEQADKCDTTWNMITITRLFQCPTTEGDADFSKIPAVDLSVFPDYTECCPVVANDDSLVGSKIALATNGVDLLSVVPEILTLFPYSFTSSLPEVSRVVSTSNTHYAATTVVQPLLRAYYGACRVRTVNTTGIYIEDTCDINKRWEIYGLMIHSPDDIPLCSTGGICIHNYYNSLWEWVNYMTADQPDRIGMNLNTFRSRYADTVSISVLPGIVVMQLLLMGVISLYQVMSHKRSVLLTQVWAYRCQNDAARFPSTTQSATTPAPYPSTHLMSPSSKTRTRFTQQQKLRLIKKAESSPAAKYEDLALWSKVEFGLRRHLGKATISRIISGRIALLRQPHESPQMMLIQLTY
ncbi:unnamed protein product [Phytophthora fragariaefolia]|uniref:Unnamed protein product n=1 Tax=Phytophthora fragariaefolia TaxID=1490495 RepID=A0A9W6X5A2_9STRA|nr:unnamed protein product [Phytophthora fragariaefolia]